LRWKIKKRRQEGKKWWASMAAGGQIWVEHGFSVVPKGKKAAPVLSGTDL